MKRFFATKELVTLQRANIQKILVRELMEDIIFFAVIASSIVFSIVKNYKKETKKNEKRIVVKQQTQSASLPTSQTPKSKRTLVISNEKDKQEINKPIDVLETLDTLESRNFDYTSQSTILKSSSSILYENEEREIFAIKEGVYNQIEEDSPISSQDLTLNSKNRFFQDKDEMKRAIIYSVLLERKY